MELIQNLIFYIVAFFIAIFILVSVHEFGHFYVARLCGVKVLRFCIGMGTPVWSFRDKHGTEFGLAPVPLGGYVKMLGEGDDGVPPDAEHESYSNKNVYQRIAILAAGPFANFVLAALIFSCTLFFSGSTGLSPTLGAIVPNSLAEKAGLQAGHEIVSIDGVPTPTRMNVLEQLFSRLGETGTLDITVREPESELLFELEVALNQWLINEGEPDPLTGLGLRFFTPPITLGTPSSGSAAELAGLKAGDVVVRTDGEVSMFASDWVKYIQAHANQEVAITVLRDGQELDLLATPALTVLEDGRSVGQLGINVGFGQWPESMIRRQSYGLFDALWSGLVKTWEKSVFVLVSIEKLIVGEISTKNLSGPIGIAKVAGDSARAGAAYYIELLAFLSITLGVMNLLPIPILDGGHILFCFIEAVKGSPVPEKIQSIGFSIGLAVLAGVMVTAFYYDILRLF